MKLIKLDHTGHAEVDLDTEQMIEALQKEMNTPGKVAIAEEPGKPPTYLRTPEQAKDLAPEARVTIAPQLMGG